MAFLLPAVYPITDKRLAGVGSHVAIIKELIRGGAKLVQIRDKSTPPAELLDDIRRCLEHAEKHEVTLIINDRCDLVLICGADGVHLGRDDLPPVAARRLLGPDRIVGLSTHNLRQVRESRQLPVDYIGFGPIYPTSTKESRWPALGTAMLRRACVVAGKPVVAIGGIGPGRVREVLDAGAASAAVISAVMERDHIADRMERLLIEATAK